MQATETIAQGEFAVREEFAAIDVHDEGVVGGVVFDADDAAAGLEEVLEDG